MSADGIIDTEFGNRFMYMPMSADIKLREKFMQDRDAYRRALSAYIAKQANEYVQAMRGLDKGEISRRADRQLSAMFDKHMLSKHGTKIESTYRDTISDFSNWLIDTARSDLKLAEFGSTQMKRRFVYVDKHKSLFYKVGSGGFEEFCRTKDMDVAKKMLAEKDTLLREMGAPVRVHCGPMGGAKGVAVVIRIVGYTWSDVVEATIGATTNEPEGQEFVF
jgi:hypothetical protein